MERLRTDSPLSRRIVLSFLDFINSVEPAPGVDLEGLHVVRECLQEVFKLDQSSSGNRVQPGLLVELFNSADNKPDFRSDPGIAVTSVNRTGTTSSQSTADSCLPEASKSDGKSGDTHVAAGISKDELFGQFYAALDKINFFMTTLGGVEDQVQLAKATRFFGDAITEMEKSGNQNINQSSLAETFKSQGNWAMQSKLYSDAIELYTCAIALAERNGVYYCNRAAAYTQIHKYTEAIADCRKSIQIDPNYSKAYSRLGLAYYAQGQYREAVFGFLKALQLDPNNNSVRENVLVAQQKWREQSRQTEDDQNTGSSPSQEQNTQSAGQTNHGTPFTSIPINASIPNDFAQFFMNMASAAGTSHSQEQDAQSAGSRNHGTPFTSTPINASMPSDFAQMFMNMAPSASSQQARGGTTNGSSGESYEPEIRVGTNINLNLQEVPEELSGVLRSVVDMFSSHHGPQENASRGGYQT